MDNWFQIARFEFLRTVRQRSFLIFSLGMPIFIIAISTIPVIIELLQSPPTVGYLDEGSLITDTTLSDSDVTLQSFANEAAGRAALDEDEISSFWIIPSDYLEGGTVQELVKGDSSNREADAISELLRSNLSEGLDAETVARLERQPEWRFKFLGSDREMQEGAGFVISLAIPVILSFILMLSIVFSAGFLAQAIAQERENRLLEMLITSTSLRSLLMGKLVGLSAAALIQVAFWLSAIAIAAILVFLSGNLPEIPIPWRTIAMALPFYILSFLLFATLIIGTGALLGDVQASQQAAGFIGALGIIPIYLIVPIIQNPSGTLAQVLSYIPFSAPIVVPTRLTFGQMGTVEWLISLAIMLISVVAAVWLLARLLRAATLRYGTRISINDIFART